MYVSRLSEEELESGDAEPRREFAFVPQNAFAEKYSVAISVSREVIFYKMSTKAEFLKVLNHEIALAASVKIFKCEDCKFLF